MIPEEQETGPIIYSTYAITCVIQEDIDSLAWHGPGHIIELVIITAAKADA